MKTAFQQIMIGTLCKKYDETLKLLKHLKEIGYDGIEINSFMIHKSNFLVSMLTSLAGMPTGKCGKLDWNKLIHESNLEVVSLHSDLGSLENNFESVLNDAEKFKTKTIVITGMYRFNYQDIAQLKKLCDRLNSVGKRLKEKGFNLLYHNHNVEFVRLSDNSICYEYIINNTDKEYVNFEFDSYWATDAGCNVLNIMTNLKQRMKLHHINDRGFKQKGPYMTPILKSDSMELGTGVMPLEEMLSLDKLHNIEYVILETHKNFIDNSPLKSLEISIEYLKKRV